MTNYDAQKITDALDHVHANYHDIIRDERMSVDARAGYLAACCQVDCDIPLDLANQPRDVLIQLLKTSLCKCNGTTVYCSSCVRGRGEEVTCSA